QRAIEASVQLGRLICQTDPVAAGHRDRAMLAQSRPRGSAQPAPASAVRPVPGGFHQVAPGGTPGLAAGQLLPPLRVLVGGRNASLDDQVGTGFTLLARQDHVLTPAVGDRLRQAGVRVVAVRSPESRAARAGTVVDVDGALTG